MIELYRQNYKENKKIYNKVLKRLRNKIGKEFPIDHVGSTALPNMYGKNIIDILVGANNEKEIDKISDILKELGYFPGIHNQGNYRFFANTEEETKKGDIHIHLVCTDTNRYKDFIILRNYLLINKEEKQAYSILKKKIIKEGKTIRNDYKLEKSKYVSDLLNRARKFMNK